MLVVLMLGFDVENEGERFWVKPWRREDVRATLTFEQGGEPQGNCCSAGRDERFDAALK